MFTSTEQQLLTWLEYYIRRCNSYTSMRRAMVSIVKLLHNLSTDKEAAVAGHQIYGAWGSCSLRKLNISFFLWADLAEIFIGDGEIGYILAVNDEEAGIGWSGKSHKLYKNKSEEK